MKKEFTINHSALNELADIIVDLDQTLTELRMQIRFRKVKDNEEMLKKCEEYNRIKHKIEKAKEILKS